MRPLAIDLYAGLGGWTEGLLAEGYDVVGFDIERHDYGDGKRYPAQLVLQDVLTLHGRQFKDAALIVASPPCQEYSYMAMPWTRAKQIAAALRGQGEFPEGYTGSRTIAELTALFDACFRIQREAIEAAGHHIPLVVENVRGAIPWVGRSRWNFGSFHLWGDVPALMPMTKAVKRPGHSMDQGAPQWSPQHHSAEIIGHKVPGFRFDGSGGSFQTTSGCGNNARDMLIEGMKTVGHVNKRNGHDHTRHLTNQAESDGVKQAGISGVRANGKGDGSRSHARKAASAMIARIPFPLARHIASVWRPDAR